MGGEAGQGVKDTAGPFLHLNDQGPQLPDQLGGLMVDGLGVKGEPGDDVDQHGLFDGAEQVGLDIGELAVKIGINKKTRILKLTAP